MGVGVCGCVDGWVWVDANVYVPLCVYVCVLVSWGGGGGVCLCVIHKAQTRHRNTEKKET